MAIELLPVKPEHAPDIARIIFEAFKNIQDKHRFPLDIPSMEVATMMTGMLVAHPDIHGVVAVDDGKIIGSNFIQISDEVGGLGPITVDGTSQSRGLGRLLMQNIIDWTRKNHGPMIRLIQETYNNTSLSLYTSLGFNVAEPLVLMEVIPAANADDSVRPLTADDVAACDELARRVIKVSRKNELAMTIAQGPAMGCIPHGRFKNGKLVAYAIPGFMGHSVGQSIDDVLTTTAQIARTAPPPMHRLFVPTRNGDFLRRALAMKFRCLKPMQLMVMGPYEEPLAPSSGAAWTPSISY